MASTRLVIVFLACALFASVVAYQLDQDSELHPRFRRFVQRGNNWANHNNQGSNGPNRDGGWSANSDVKRGSDGSLTGSVGVEHRGPNHRVGADVRQTVHGPGKQSRPQVHVGGEYRW